ncbi:uncharacterized protein [Penaeus vannamei]|uniref:uncharacterized protein n=1 Tax=Penaeus vannamei TaxID=6689 RepID=UPI00387F7A0A
MTGLYSGRLRSSMSGYRRRHDAPYQTLSYKGGDNSHYEKGRTQTPPQKNKLQTFLSHDSDSSRVTEGENGLYLADVGCGFPTLTAVNLKKDIGKVFLECCLEYCLVKKGQQFIRMHCAGDCIPEGEEGNVNSEGWRPVFSFNLTPRDLSFFKHSMKLIYVDKETSPYFGELHAICYISSHEMIAVKNEELIQSKAIEGSRENAFCNLRKVRSRVKQRQDELIEVLYENFFMIPRTEVDIALKKFFNMK